MIVDVAVSVLLLVVTSIIQYYRKLAQTKAQLHEEYELKLAQCQKELKDAHRFIAVLKKEMKTCFKDLLRGKGLYHQVCKDIATQTCGVTNKVSMMSVDDLEMIAVNIIQSQSKEKTRTGANRSKLDPGSSEDKDYMCTEVDNHSNVAESERTVKENQIEPVETGQHCPDTVEGSGDENCANNTQEKMQSQVISSKYVSLPHEKDEIHQDCGKLYMQNEEFLDLLLMEDALLDNGPLSDTAASENLNIALEETSVGGLSQTRPELIVDCGVSKRPAPSLESFTYYCSMDNYDLVTGPKGRNLQFLQQAFGVQVVVLQDDPRYKSLNVVGTTIQLTEARNYLENGVLGRIVERDLTRVLNSNSHGTW